MDIEPTKAEEEARKRRERLKNLRNRVSNTNQKDENNENGEELPKYSIIIIHFKIYKMYFYFLIYDFCC